MAEIMAVLAEESPASISLTRHRSGPSFCCVVLLVIRRVRKQLLRLGGTCWDFPEIGTRENFLSTGTSDVLAPELSEEKVWFWKPIPTRRVRKMRLPESNVSRMIGQAISHYCIVEKLDGGGMGVVYNR